MQAVRCTLRVERFLYFRCGACGLVWSLAKPGRNARDGALLQPRFTGVALLTHTVAHVTSEARKRAQPGQPPAAILRDLVDPLPIAALIADDRGRYVLANRAAATLTGYTVPELHQLSVWQLTPHLLQDDAERLWQRFLSAGEQSGDYQLLAKGNQVVSAQYAAMTHVLRGAHLSLLLAA